MKAETDIAASQEALATFPQYLLLNSARFAGRTAMRHKDYGIWQSWTWAQMAEEIARFSIGLGQLGLKAGDRVAIVGQNRPRLYWTFCAVQALGAIPVPVYADSVADEMVYVLNHAEVAMAVVQDQEQVDKLLSMGDALPGLRLIIYDEPRGLRDYDHAQLQSFAQVQAAGQAAIESGARDAWLKGIAAGKGFDLSVMLYTSGTTGKPKGVMLSFDNLVISARNGNVFDTLSSRRGSACLSAAGLGRRSRLLLCASLCRRLLRVLSGRSADRERRPA